MIQFHRSYCRHAIQWIATCSRWTRFTSNRLRMRTLQNWNGRIRTHINCLVSTRHTTPVAPRVWYTHYIFPLRVEQATGSLQSVCGTRWILWPRSCQPVLCSASFLGAGMDLQTLVQTLVNTLDQDPTRRKQAEAFLEQVSRQSLLGPK